MRALLRLTGVFVLTAAGTAVSAQNPAPAAVQEQLGLRLESRREPVEVLVVDSASAPTEN